MRKLWLIAILICAMTLIAFSMFQFSPSARQNAAGKQRPAVVVTVSSSSDRYILGQLVGLNFSVTNTGTAEVATGGIDIGSGYLKIYIAPESGAYREYRYGGVIRHKKLILKPGETQSATAGLLANRKPQTSHLSDSAAAREMAGVINSHFAFPEVGVYFVKAVLVIPDADSTRIESTALRLEIESPQGQDLEIWNAITQNPEIAHLIQYGSIRSKKQNEKAELIQRVEQLATSESKTVLSHQLRQALERYSEGEKRREKLLERQPN